MIDDSLQDDPDLSQEQDEGSKIYVPVGSIGSSNPKIGDEVEFRVKGQIESLDGDTVCVSPMMINGKPMSGSPESMHDKLQREAYASDDAE